MGTFGHLRHYDDDNDNENETDSANENDGELNPWAAQYLNGVRVLDRFSEAPSIADVLGNTNSTFVKLFVDRELAGQFLKIDPSVIRQAWLTGTWELPQNTKKSANHHRHGFGTHCEKQTLRQNMYVA